MPDYLDCEKIEKIEERRKRSGFPDLFLGIDKIAISNYYLL